MRGFDADFTDLPDYILKITERIWEGRGIDLIRRYYTDDCVLRTPGGVILGADAVVQSTLETLHEFPDRRLLGEDVVWAGDDERGYYSSHRIMSTMHHRGSGRFGAATGRPIAARTIADCAVRENQIYEEWLVRDQGAIARQIGSTPKAIAAAWVAAQGDTPATVAPPGRYAGMMDDDADAARYGEGWRRIWGERDLRTVGDLYGEAVALALPGGVSAAGRGAIDAFCVGYLAAFPGADFSVDHLIARYDDGLPVRVAMRWTLDGDHTGQGAFGAPSGSQVRIAGINQAHMAGGKVTAEWIVVDEVAVWQQILGGSA